MELSCCLLDSELMATGSERMIHEGIKPWNKLPSETDEAYSAFCLYLNMGEKRSMAALVTTIDKTLSIEQLNSWSNTFSWTKRVRLCEIFIQDQLLNNSTRLSSDTITRHKIELTTSTSNIPKQLKAKYFPIKGRAKHSAH